MAFDVVITSNLRRSKQTAELLGCRGAQCLSTDLCAERCFGIMEGLTWDEVQDLDPPVLFVEVGGERHSVNPSEGEPFEDVWQRARELRALIFREHPGASLLVVSHGVFLQMFHGLLRGLCCIESLGSYPGNLELTTFHFEDDRLVSEEARAFAAEAQPSF